MPYQISQTTAEEIISATDAVLQKNIGAGINLIAGFLTTSVPNAQNAINMAVEIGLVRQNQNQEYEPLFPYASYLCTGNAQQKAAVLRFILEEYKPYKLFKSRLKITSSAPDSATQIKALLNLSADRTEICNTLISLGTYTNSIRTQGAGRYTPNTTNEYNFIRIVNEVVQNRQSAELLIRERLGEDICNWIDLDNVLNPLITSFQRAANADIDSRAPIVHCGNAFESFLVQVASYYNVNVTGAPGINAKIDQICQAHFLTTKHKNICKYLGHIRNAVDHGIDQEINQTWNISSNTSQEYVHVCLTTIRSIYDCLQGNYII